MECSNYLRNFIRNMKRRMTRDDLHLYGIDVKVATKVLPALLMVFLLISLIIQMSLSHPLDCSYDNQTATGSVGKSETQLNRFCWQHELFLVKYALDPSYKEIVQYPGVTSYKKGEHGLVSLDYYKHVNLFLTVLIIISCITGIAWKIRDTIGIKRILFTRQTISDEEDNWDPSKSIVVNFLTTIGFHKILAIQYSKFILATLVSVIFQWVLSIIFFGSYFIVYGVHFIIVIFESEKRWPTPSQTLFPGTVLCEDFVVNKDTNERFDAICHLPMSTFYCWTFFGYWWLIFLTLCGNLITFTKLIAFTFPCFRTLHYQFLIKSACADMIKDRKSTDARTGNELQKIRFKDSALDIIQVDIGFADGLALDMIISYLKKVQKEIKFLRELVLTPNPYFYIIPVGSVADVNPDRVTIANIDNNDEGAHKRFDQVELNEMSHDEVDAD